MSVITKTALEDLDGMTAEACEFDDECFLCGEKLSLPFIYWMGATKNICLHGRCAEEFAQKLRRDHQDFISL